MGRSGLDTEKAVVRIIAATGVLVVLLAACGTDGNPGDSGGGNGHHGTEAHGVVEVGADAIPPRISIEVTEDRVEGWNLRVALSNFRLAPENVSGPHVDGEGHMHLYIDGRKVSRVYGLWHHIGALEAGEHEIRVELSANDHSRLAVNGEIIGATTTVMAPEPESRATEHDHGEERAATQPYPSLSLRIVDDPAGGWNLHAVPSDFRLAPGNVSGPHVDGEGHMHLFIDGRKVARLYGTWYQLPPLDPGTHEIRVDLRSNDHALLTVGGAGVDAVASLEVSHEEATALQDEGHTHDGNGGHATAGDRTSWEVDIADADQTVAIQILSGEPVGGPRRVQVDLGSVVALEVTSDVAGEVHVHGYDILKAVAAGDPAHFAFIAEIPGVFEVELEGSGQLLLQLEIS